MQLRAFTLATFLLAAPALAQAGTNVNWPLYTGDPSGSRFKPLDQINAANFSSLQIAWRFKTDNIGNRPEYKLEGTPSRWMAWSMPRPDRAAPWWRWMLRPAN